MNEQPFDVARLGKLRGGVPLGVTPSTCPGMPPCYLAVVSRSERSVPVWMCDSKEFGLPSSAHLQLSGRSLRQLGMPEPQVPEGAQALLGLPRVRRVSVVAARVDDLPGPGDLHVSPALFAHIHPSAGTHRFGMLGQLRRRWVLAVHGRIAVPLRTRCRARLPEGDVVADFVVRALLSLGEAGSGVPDGSSDPYWICSLPRVTPHDRKTMFAQRGRFRGSATVITLKTRVLGVVRWVLRHIDLAVEYALRVALRAPSVMVAVVQAHPGDDIGDVVRLHPILFAELGVDPGGQVLVEWAGRRSVARALPQILEEQQSAREGMLAARQVGLHDSEAFPGTLPEHLFVQVSARVRHELGIPAHTVVVVSRRVRTHVITRLTRLTLPALGLVFAGAAVPALRWGGIAAGIAVVLILGLADVRIPRPPPGLWP